MSLTPNDPADFSPIMSTYTGQGNFRFWCQVALPLVYDDSLSYYELLCKVVTYLNNVINDVSATEENVDKLKTAYDELQGYVNDYFENLDVQDEINTKLDEMATDGSLDTLLDPIVATKVSAWLASHITPTTPAIDNTLKISGAGADSKKVGDLLFRDNPHDTEVAAQNVISLPLVKQPTASSIDAFADFKIHNQYYVTGVTLKALLTPYQNQSDSIYHVPNFDDIPNSTAVTYVILKINAFARTSNGYMVFIISQGGSYMWVGHKKHEAPTITYNNNEYDGVTFTSPIAPLDTTLALTNRAAEAKATGDAFATINSLIYRGNSSSSFTPITPLFSSLSSVASLESIPKGCYGTISGSHLLEIIPDGDNDPVFPSKNKINSSSTYILYKIGLHNTNEWCIYYISSYSGSYIWRGYVASGASGWELVKHPEELIMKKLLRYSYTDFDTTLNGAYATDGTIVTNSGNTLKRSQMLRVNPNEKVYVGLRLNTTASSKTVATCACFDKFGNLISCVSPSSLTEYKAIESNNYNSSNPNYYPCPDGSNNQTYATTDYLTLYYFTTPDDCYYICVPTFSNISQAQINQGFYKYNFSNCDAFRLYKSQNITIFDGDRHKLSKKLCVIGPSTAMIDRLQRNMNTASGGSALNQYVCGFQEYLKPYYSEVRTFGYSTAAYFSDSDTSFTGYLSIYDSIANPNSSVTQPDLSGYDEFLLLPSTNGVSTITRIGDYNSNDVKKYFGGLNGVISKILTVNPKAVIYVNNMSSYIPNNPNNYDLMLEFLEAYDTEYDKLGRRTCCALNDIGSELGWGYENKLEYTYDHVHYNQEGSQLLGEFLVNKMCVR